MLPKKNEPQTKNQNYITQHHQRPRRERPEFYAYVKYSLCSFLMLHVPTPCRLLA